MKVYASNPPGQGDAGAFMTNLIDVFVTSRAVLRTASRRACLAVAARRRPSGSRREGVLIRVLCLLCVSMTPFATAASDLKWIAVDNPNWNLTTSNWLNLVTSTPDKFTQGDAVRFDDSGAFAPQVHVALALAPSTLTVDSSSIAYAFSGPGKLSGLGGGLIKNGTSTLTLATANDFAGPVQITAGAIKLGHATALGSAAGGVSIAAGAALDLAGFSAGAEAIELQGAGQDGNGAIINTGAALLNDGLRGVVTLLGNTSIGGPNRWEIVGGPFLGNGHKLTKVGPSEVVLHDLGQTGLGEIGVQQGTLTLAGNTLPGDPAKALTVHSNAILAFLPNGTRIIQKTLFLETATVQNLASSETDTTANSGAILLSGHNTFDVAGTLRLQGEIGGLGGLTKIGTGTLALDNDNFYAGDTIIAEGRLMLGAEGGVGGSPQIVVRDGAILDASGLPEFTVRAAQHLVGNGAVHGTVVVGIGSFLNPGHGVGTLTVTHDLVLRDSSTVNFELAPTTAQGSFNDLVRVGGSVHLDGYNYFHVVPRGRLDPAHAYTLIEYSGTLNGSPASITPTSDTRMSFAVDTTSTPGQIKLTVASGGPAVTEWTGANPVAPAAWDVKTTTNWKTSDGPDQFYAGDFAVFNDAATTFEVDLVEDVFPAQTRVEASADYRFVGSGSIRGGSLTKSLAGKLTLANSGLNDYPGPTVITGGTLQVGMGGTAGSLGLGPITNDAQLVLHRSDRLTLVNPIFGAGNIDILMGSGLVLDETAQVTLDGSTGGGSLNVGEAEFGRLLIRDGAHPVVGRLSLGGDGASGEVIQDGGNFVVSRHAIIGRGPNETSTYVMDNGTLSLTNVPSASAGERDGILYIGADGTGVFLQRGGLATADGIVLDGRGHTAGDDTFSLEGGTFTIGASGIASGNNNANLTYSVRLGGGQVTAKSDWSSTLNMQLTGTNGDAVLDTRAHTITLSGSFSGDGGLIKNGTGTLVLAGTNAYQGSTRINNGTLVLLGPLGVGTGELRVASGAFLAGTSVIRDTVMIEAGGTLSPGTAPGAIGTITTASGVQLLGLTRMDLAKSGSTLSNDRIIGAPSLTLGGSLSIHVDGEPLSEGDTFQVFEAASFHGTFASVDLPSLPFGLNWDLGELSNAGRIKVVALRLAASTVAGNNLGLSASGGTPGSPYRVVASFDLATPLSTWEQIASGVFDRNGSFSISIPINPAEPQRYHAIRVP